MNIYSQVCGLIIVLLIFYFYFRQPTMGLKSEKSFRNVLITVLVCDLLDILSCIIIVNSDWINDFFVELIARFYLCSLNSVAYFTLVYTVTGVYEKIPHNKFKLKKYIYRTIYILDQLLMLTLPIDIIYDGDVLYSAGKACYTAYISSLFLILTVIFETFYHKKYINPKRRGALITWMLLWVLAAAIQFFFPHILIVGFAACAGCLIIFFEMENPEAAISRRTGHFSSSVIREYFDYMYANKRHFSVLMLSFNTVGDSTHDSTMLRKAIEALSDFLFSIKNCKVFDTAEGYFIMVFNKPDFIESTKFQIKNFFATASPDSDLGAVLSLLCPFYTIVPDSHIASTSDELLSVMTSFMPSEHKNYEANEIIVDENTISNLRDKKAIEDMVVEALENDRVEVFYQPIYNVKEDLFTSAEALVRIRLKNGKLVFPGTFIPIIEETGRIIPLSDAVYRKALSFIHAFRIERLKLNYIELNLSVRQGESPSFTDHFHKMLKEYQVSPEQVNLEITETSSLISKENILLNMNKLVEDGISFSLDDFGSGSSNLNYIIDMPVKYVKLDKDLTTAYLENDRAKSIVNAVIEMAHSIGISIIAEGIETKEALEEMKSLGVDYIQGYYFSPPVEEREFLSFIQKNNLK